MAKKQSEFLCDKCGAKFPKWRGRCTHCGEWETLKEVGSHFSGTRSTWVDSGNSPQNLGTISNSGKADRWLTGVYEFDRVTGGGIMAGSIGLLGGAPGVGKSTLILQLLARIQKLGKKVLYISGEESLQQIKHRADRLLIKQDEIMLFVESQVEQILHTIDKYQPDFIVIDSIQTLYTDQFSASSGSVTQVRESAGMLMKHTKNGETAILLIGHVTKDGDIAGPRTLEHMVDFVLYLEGEKKEQKRILRTVKNRFGTLSEVGLFKMTAKGLVEINKPNQLFFEKYSTPHPGMAIFATSEGSRTLFLEIQVLVGDTEQRNPARTCIGMDRNRLLVIVAILEKHLQLDLSSNDIYLNLAEGFKVNEPALDMAVVAALISSHLLKPLQPRSVFIGEIALTGEFRAVPVTSERVYEAARCGFKRVYLPAQTSGLSESSTQGVEIIPVNNVQFLIDLLS